MSEKLKNWPSTSFCLQIIKKIFKFSNFSSYVQVWLVTATTSKTATTKNKKSLTVIGIDDDVIEIDD